MKKKICIVFLLSFTLLISIGGCKESKIETYKLTCTDDGNGTVTFSPDKKKYEDGTSVTITAVPNEGYEFSYWGGDVSGITGSVTVEVNNDMDFEVAFKEIASGYTLTCTAENGSVSKYPDYELYAPDTVVSLTLTPDEGFRYKYYEGDDIEFGLIPEVTMDSDKSVQFYFTDVFNTLTCYDLYGYVTRSPDYEYYDGETVTITATGSTGYVFDHWTGDYTGTDNPTDIVVDTSKTITPVFKTTTTYTISTEVSGSGSITTDPVDTSFNSNSSVSVEAVPEPGYMFDHWEGDLSGSTNPRDLYMSANRSIKAVFVPREWTVMIYLDGDNDLETEACNDFNEMESADLSGSGIQVVTLFDRAYGEDFRDSDWKDTRLYEISHGSHFYNFESKRLASTELGITTDSATELNMGDPETAKKFIDFCKSKYPANNYAFIFWNHGTGWRSSSNSIVTYSTISNYDILKNLNLQVSERIPSNYKAVCVDESTSNNDMLFTEEIGDIFSTRSVDVVGFDTCLAGMMEVAYEIKDHADYMIASEEVEDGDGWEYDDWLNTFKGTSKTAEDMIESVVSEYADKYQFTSGATLAGIKLSEIDNVHTALNNFSTALFNSITTGTIQDELQTLILSDVEGYASAPGDLNIDMYHLAEVVSANTNYADAEAATLKTAIAAAIKQDPVDNWNFCCINGNPNSHGLALHFIHLNDSGVPDGHNEAYARDYTGSYSLNFVDDSKWVIDSTDGFLYNLWYKEF